MFILINIKFYIYKLRRKNIIKVLKLLISDSFITELNKATRELSY